MLRSHAAHSNALSVDRPWDHSPAACGSTFDISDLDGCFRYFEAHAACQELDSGDPLASPACGRRNPDLVQRNEERASERLAQQNAELEMLSKARDAHLDVLQETRRQQPPRRRFHGRFQPAHNGERAIPGRLR